MPLSTKPKFYICREAFAVTLDEGDVWFKAGQRVPASHRVFQGESGENRKHLFTPAEED